MKIATILGETSVPVTDGSITIGEDIVGAETYSDLAKLADFPANQDTAPEENLVLLEIKDIPDDASLEQLWKFCLLEGFAFPTEHQIASVISGGTTWFKGKRDNPSTDGILIPFTRSRMIFTVEATPTTVDGKVNDQLAIFILPKDELVEQKVARAILRKAQD